MKRRPKSTQNVISASKIYVPYETCILSTGSYAFIPPIPGWDKPGVFVYCTIKDLTDIISYTPLLMARQLDTVGGKCFKKIENLESNVFSVIRPRDELAKASGLSTHNAMEYLLMRYDLLTNLATNGDKRFLGGDLSSKLKLLGMEILDDCTLVGDTDDYVKLHALMKSKKVLTALPGELILDVKNGQAPNSPIKLKWRHLYYIPLN
ncbi:3880_t:CDS:2 [Funneliformis mosseae]|uniref:3880_t:CDS:1 n=1 Tax=Funneliformis mosseae TaxID=27381 RepID=A0A9N9CMX1_FUNMO|nr:3880_t:CDS:2 [Funneliformis mosseae]